MEDDTDKARGLQLVSWDAAPAQRFFVHIVSCILYARGAFPEDCFRCVSDQEWEDPHTTHESLLNSGEPLASSESLKNIILSQRGPFIYPRRTQNLRLDAFLHFLNGTLAAIQQQRLGKYQICFSRSKSWDAEALIEFYDLKLRYTKYGSLYVYVKWRGAPDTAIPTNCNNPFNEFLRIRSPIIGTYYTHPFICSSDGKPLDKEADDGLGKVIKQAISLLQGKPHSGSGRIGTLVYHSKADILQKEEDQHLAETKALHQEIDPAETKTGFARGSRQAIPDVHCNQAPLDETIDFSEHEQESDWIANSNTCSVLDLASEKPLRSGNSGWKARMNSLLSVREEVSDELPPTQLLSSQQFLRQQPSSQQLPSQHLKRPRDSSLDPVQQDSLPHPSKSTLKRRHTGRSTRSSSLNILSQLDASMLQPPSSAELPSEPASETIQISASSSKPRTSAPSPGTPKRYRIPIAARFTVGKSTGVAWRYGNKH